MCGLGFGMVACGIGGVMRGVSLLEYAHVMAPLVHHGQKTR